MSCVAGTASSPDCVDVEVALAFVHGRLADDRRAEIEHRIDVCSRCRGVIAEAARDSELATALERPARTPRPASDSGVLVPGEKVGRYLVERPLGAGGMGVVSLARDPELRRAVVIKLVRPDVDADDKLEARLEREAQAMAQLSHPNVVQIFDIGRHGERVFIAMEFIAGQTLDAWLIAKERSVDEILAMFRQAAAGLDAAHRAGLVHRDFKPANVLVNGEGVVKVTDFGLARATTAASSLTGMPAARPSSVLAVLTHRDAVIGTPAYMAPEQLTGGEVDARTDQYAFALALLDALLGQGPGRRAVSPADGADAIERALVAASVSPPVRAAITRGLRSEPSERFGSIAELARELEPERRRARWWPLAAAAAVVAGAAIWLGVRGSATCRSESPELWAARRARVVEAIGMRTEPFAAWTAASIAAAIDADADQLGRLELARCEKGVLAKSDCLDERRRAMATAMDALEAGRSFDAWSQVRAIERCDAAPPAELAPLHAELTAETPAERARAIAERAHQLGADALASAAYRTAGRAAFAADDLAAAERDLREASAAALRIGDDGAHGRARLDLLELARWRCEHDAVISAITELDGLAARHTDDARGQLTVALARAAALTDVGDATRGFAEWQLAITAATKLGDASALLRAKAGQAHARWLLQLDDAAARHEIDAALADRGAADADSIAEAQSIRAQLALDRGDAAEASAATAELRRSQHDDPYLSARARALAGEPAAALADVAAIPGDDATTKVRRLVARSAILKLAGRAAEAEKDLFAAASAFLVRPTPHVPRIQVYEIELAKCELAPAVPDEAGCLAVYSFDHGLAANAAMTARYKLAAALVEKAPSSILAEALATLQAVGAPRLKIADTAWRLARTGTYNLAEDAAHAREARAVFAAAGRTAQVAEIDRWLANKGLPLVLPPEHHDPNDPWGH